MEAQLLSMPPQVQSLGHSAAFDSLEDSLLRDLEETVRAPKLCDGIAATGQHHATSGCAPQAGQGDMHLLQNRPGFCAASGPSVMPGIMILPCT